MKKISKKHTLRFLPDPVMILITLALLICTAAPLQASEKEKTTRLSFEYFPMAVGASWTFSSAETGNISVYRVSGITKVGKFDSFRMESRNNSGQLLGADYFTVVKDQVLMTGYEDLSQKQASAYEPPITALMIPLEPGLSWPITRRNSQGQLISETRRVIGEEKVSVPAGEYQTILVRSEATINGNPATIDRWYARGVGMVRLKYSQGGKNIIFSLTQYTAGK